MENSINQRIKELIEKEGMNINSFSKKVGLTQSVLDSMFKKNTEPSSKTIVSILNAYPLLSSEWLLRGESNMFSPCQTRPRIPYTAAAGVLTNVLDGVTCEQCEQIPVVKILPDYDFTIVLKGNSMEPKYEGGDEVACKRVDNTSFIQWGKTHVLNTSQGIIIKRIYEDGNKIKCVSYNQEYPPFSIDRQEIYSISLVVGLVRI